MEVTDSATLERIAEATTRVLTRSLVFGAVGAGLGFTWGILRGAAVARTYTVLVGANTTLASLPCFALREIIGDRIPDLPASVISGAVGGLALTTAYAGKKQAVKGTVLFGLAGLTVQQANEQFIAWKSRKRDEIIRERASQ